ncbi:MAG: hypothetical protein GEV03_14010 [Streptosporangiales bacterium]|nr:hypothetical protein [Streptosporangiales bacterium]
MDRERKLRASPQANLGPTVEPGGEKTLGGPVPPYEGRLRTAKATRDEHMRKVMSGKGGEPGLGRVISDVERAGVPATDTTAASPLGVGKSMSAQGNKRALGKSEEEPGAAGTEADRGGRAYRAGDRKDRTAAGIRSGQPTDPEMPNLRPGDQGG